MKKTEFALESFKNIQELIKFVEQKSGAVLVIAGLIFTGYIEFLKNLEFSEISSISLFGVIVFLSSISTAISLMLLIHKSIFKVLKPRLAKNYQGNEISLMYYEHLCCIDRDEIYSKYENLTEKKILKDIIGQQHEIAKILSEKILELGKTFNYLFISLFSVIIFIINTFQL
ncbi:hypothetical protein [Tenacibaculum finnmarkense]|uniref:Pycsar effector protein domain-containing protein n=1 Tax=Tenacibaculum finnmarkense genomovar finnmarkense TaxID=1458503 RepID=A0AAP1RHH4_9FLAO|nr:hypothetical protein [Tenacibaculum finnmarkense]MBE7696315.1 hypothetical protein [Tenacibaculum finnmarkense genomovar finnmarkense]MCD8428562.1 hypothetical protein [Tenacibaculum finnmarkense genomovar finnmarkense]MCD8440970.1 hypothetical protein [Tenacibaculum finnmarkense genomovar ulcerans]MCG8721893.1 hypothetical protein [Tenacibaculum finnmarkense]MCG8732359.1 hypothetical protein [Tenacibaculum finnmarkense]